jgi:hypothetical protein
VPADAGGALERAIADRRQAPAEAARNLLAYLL